MNKKYFITFLLCLITFLLLIATLIIIFIYGKKPKSSSKPKIVDKGKHSKPDIIIHSHHFEHK